MINLIFSLRYLSLKNEHHRLLVRRDVGPLLAFVAGFLVINYFVPSLNFFGNGGIAEKLGSFSATLTGFYVAALVAAAAFTSKNDGLDQIISNGAIYSVGGAGKEPEPMTRREYICSIFAYLSLLALILSVVSIISVAIAGAVETSNIPNRVNSLFAFSLIAKSIFFAMTAHLIITTGQGLYYLSYRLYMGDGSALNRTDDSDPRQ